MGSIKIDEHEAFDGKHCPACREPALEKARKPDGQEAFFCAIGCRWLGGRKEAEDLLSLKAYIKELEEELREKDPLAGIPLGLALAEPQAPERIATVQVIDDLETPPRAPRPEELPEELRAKVDDALKAGPVVAAKPKERKGGRR